MGKIVTILTFSGVVVLIALVIRLLIILDRLLCILHG